MKKIFPLLFSLVLYLGAASKVQAATLYWVGADGANASVASNWSTTDPTSCSTGVTLSGAAPGSADIITFDGNCDNSAVIDGSFAASITAINMATGYIGTVTLSNPLILTSTSSNAFIISSGTFNSTNQTITLSAGGGFNLAGGTYRAPSTTQSMPGPFTISSGTFDTTTNAGGTINFDGGSATLSCNNATFNLVTFNNSSGTKTVNTNCSLPLGSNPTLAGGGNITLQGTLSGSGTLTKTSGAFTLNNAATTLSGFSALSTSAFVVSGATIDLSSYTSFSASSTTTVSSGSLALSSQANTLVALTVNGGVVTQTAGTFSASGTVTLSTGSLTLSSGADLNGALTISGGTFNAPSGTMTLAGALTISGSPTFNANGGTITFDGSGATLSCNNVAFNLITFSNTALKTVSTGCTLPLGNNPTLGGTQGITLINGGTLTGLGTLTMPTSTTLTISTGSTLSGASGFSGMTLQLLTVSGGTADFSSYSSFTVSSTVSLSSGSLSLPSGADLDGALTISNGTFNAPSGTMTLAGALTISGSPTFNANGGTITFDGTGDATLTCNSVTFNLVTFAHTGSGTKTIGTNCTIPVGNNPTVTGRIRMNAATAVLSGTGTFTSTCELSNCLRITSGSFTGFNGLIIYGNLSVDGGTLNLSNYDPVTIYGRNASQSLSVSGGGIFTAPSGVMTVYDGVNIQATFNHNNGTLRYLAEPTDTLIGFTGMTASVSLYNLIVDPEIAATFNVIAGCELIILGDLTMQGTSENSLLSLRSSSAGTQWSIDAQGSRTLQYLDVQDSNNTRGLTMSAFCSTDSGNNTGWLFPPCGGSLFSLVSPGDRTYTRDERPTFSWRPPGERNFFDAASEYTLVVDNGQGSDFVVEGILAQRPNGSNIYEAEKYRAEYLNWDNEDLSDNLISLKTKSSTTWPQGYNDGKLIEGKRQWRIRLKDSSNTIYEMNNELFVDFTPPTTTLSKINSLNYVPATLTSDATPTIFGKVTDEFRGIPADRKVAAGPKLISILIEKKTAKGYEQVLTDAISLSKSYWEDTGKEIENNTENRASKSSPFEYTPSKPLTNGTYVITLKSADNVDNSFTTQLFQIRVGAYDEVYNSLNAEHKTTYADQIDESNQVITVPDPNEDQQKVERSLNEQLNERNKTVANQSTNTAKSINYWLLGLGFLLVVITWWLFIIWKDGKKKKLR